MKKSFLLALTLAVSAQIASAGIPKNISYQGVLRNADGSFVQNGQYSMKFKIYDSQNNGVLLWNEVDTLSVTQGVFNAYLGKNTSLNLAFDIQYWISVTVGTDPELARVPLVSTPYAFHAVMADTAQVSVGPVVIPDGSVTTPKLADQAVTTAKTADLAVTTQKLADQAVTNAKVAANAITSADIVDGTILSADMQDGAVTTGKLADGAVSNAKVAANAIDSSKILDGTITAADLQPNILTRVRVSNNTAVLFPIPARAAFTITIAEGTYGSPPTSSSIAYVHCLADGYQIGWSGVDGTGAIVRGSAALNSNTAIVTARSTHVGVWTPNVANQYELQLWADTNYGASRNPVMIGFEAGFGC